jgi:hypothetical protein
MALEPFVIDPQRTAIAIAYRNKEMIADMVMPRVPVPTEAFEWTEYDESQYFAAPDNRIGRLSPPNQAEFSSLIRTARCVDYGLRDIVPQKDIDNSYPGYDPLNNATLQLTALNMLCRERDVAKIVFDPANHTNKVTLSGSARWSEVSTSTPDIDVLDALDQPLVRPNVAVFGETTWRYFRRHPRVVQNIFAASGPGVSGAAGNVSRQQVAEWLELDAVLVGRAWINSAKPGQAANYTKAWGKSAAFLYLNPDIAFSTQMITWGFTAQYRQLQVDTYFNQDIGSRGAQVVRNTECRIEIVSAKGASYLFAEAVD